MTREKKAAVIRVAAKDMRDHFNTTPLERDVLRQLIDLEDASLEIMFDALKSTGFLKE